MSDLWIVHHIPALETSSLVTHTHIQMTVVVLKCHGGTQGPRMFYHVEKQFAYGIKYEYPHLLIEFGGHPVRLDIYFQAVLFIHLGGQPDHCLEQTFTMQDRRTQVDAKLAGHLDRFRQPLL